MFPSGGSYPDTNGDSQTADGNVSSLFRNVLLTRPRRHHLSPRPSLMRETPLRELCTDAPI
jgi:hypothetical protein